MGKIVVLTAIVAEYEMHSRLGSVGNAQPIPISVRNSCSVGYHTVIHTTHYSATPITPVQSL